MRVSEYKYRNEDGMDVLIVVDFIDRGMLEGHWRIADVGYKRPRQRNYTYLSKEIREDSEYRRQKFEDRSRYALEKLIEFAGKDRIVEALNDAYAKLKPSFENIDSGIC